MKTFHTTKCRAYLHENLNISTRKVSQLLFWFLSLLVLLSNVWRLFQVHWLQLVSPSTLCYIVCFFTYLVRYPFFWEKYIPLVFYLKYFLFFYENISRPCVSRMTLSVVWTSNFHQAIFLRVLFSAFGTCLSSSTGFPVVSIFSAFEAPQGRWDVLFNSLETIADLHLLGNMGLIKCHNARGDLDSFLAFSNEIPSYVCNSLFHGVNAISSSVANANSLLLITPLEVLSFSCGYALHFVVWEVFIFNMFSACLRLFTSINKLPFLVFFAFSGVAFVEITFLWDCIWLYIKLRL